MTENTMIKEIISTIETMREKANKAYDEARTAERGDIDATIRCVAARERANALYDVLILIGNIELKAI